MIYIIATIISMFLSYIATKLYKINGARAESKGAIQKFFLLLSCIPLTFVSAFRFMVGTDYPNYYYIYTGIRSGDGLEPGFKYFNKILHYFSDNPYFFFFISSTIICGIFFFLIYKYSLNPAYSIMLFLLSHDYILSLSAVRQYLAIAIALLAIPYIKRKKWLSVLIITAIAASFHITALIIIPLYVLYLIKLTPKKGIIFLAISASIVGSLYTIAKWFSIMFVDISNKLYYFSEESTQSGINFSLSFFLVNFAVFIFFSFIYGTVQKSQTMQLAYAASFIGIIIGLATSVLPGSLIRFIFYLTPIFIIYVPEIVETIPYKKYKYLFNIVIIAGYIAWYVWQMYFQKHNYLPYQSIF